MHRWLLILMIALLPLRGWVGDVMAVEMASKSFTATENIANYSIPKMANDGFNDKNTVGTHAECPGHADMPNGLSASSTGTAVLAATAENGNEPASGHCNTCSTCQICHTVALTSHMALNPPGFTPHALPATGSIRFASAFTALGQKPPIA